MFFCSHEVCQITGQQAILGALLAVRCLTCSLATGMWVKRCYQTPTDVCNLLFVCVCTANHKDG